MVGKRILLGIAALLFAVSIGYCEEKPLQLSIEANKEIYRTGEDEITINVSFTNKSAKDIYLFGYLSFSIVNNTAKQDVSAIMKELMEENQTLWEKQILAPSQSINKAITFIPNNNLANGQYAITFSFNSVVSKEANATSNAINVEFTEKK